MAICLSTVFLKNIPRARSRPARKTKPRQQARVATRTGARRTPAAPRRAKPRQRRRASTRTGARRTPAAPRAGRSPGSKRAAPLERAHAELRRRRAGHRPSSGRASRLKRAHAELPRPAPDEPLATSARPASNERTVAETRRPPPRDAAWSPRRRPDERPAEQPAERSDRCHCRGPRPPAARPPSPIATEGVRREVTRQREVARCRGAGVRRPERPGRSGGRPASRLEGARREPPVPPLPPSRPIVLEPIRAPAGSCVRLEGAIAALPARAPGRPPGGVSPQKPPSCSRLGPRNSLTNQVTSR